MNKMYLDQTIAVNNLNMFRTEMLYVVINNYVHFVINEYIDGAFNDIFLLSMIYNNS